jgi:glycogen debranching enzyme
MTTSEQPSNDDGPGRPLQPLLHDATILLRAPSQLWCSASGDLGDRPIDGFYSADLRLLRDIRLRVGGRSPDPIAYAPTSAWQASFVALPRRVGAADVDPRLRIERDRTVTTDGIAERITLINGGVEPVDTTISVALTSDRSSMAVIRAGRGTGVDPQLTEEPESVIIDAEQATARVEAAGAQLRTEGPMIMIDWTVQVAALDRTEVAWQLTVQDTTRVVDGAPGTPQWAGLSARTTDSRLRRWVRTAADDLTALRMTTSKVPGETFLAAGAPWFFTLFGRDSILAARLLLPTGTEIAASTLRVLAGLQGTEEIAETAEQPGKIMHELRSETLALGEGTALPPLYYGTVDATALWIILLYEAWQAGMPTEEIAELLPTLNAALAWLRDFGDADGDGFAEYIDRTGHGLANQGWKDSGDSIQWRDGRLATGPIALVEVQGYAYQAAIGGAELLQHFGGDAEPWREWAAQLKRRFADRFWIDDPSGPYPAIALDADKQPVDSLTSNIGHLLGTGILQPGQAQQIADRLISPELNSGYGLRTMSTLEAGYWPLSYHGGAVWAHDTAIVITGLLREGLTEAAEDLAEGLLKAADGFGYRMPELHSGDAAAQLSRPVPYPAACRPQAWSAAAAIAVASAFGAELIIGRGQPEEVS